MKLEIWVDILQVIFHTVSRVPVGVNLLFFKNESECFLWDAAPWYWGERSFFLHSRSGCLCFTRSPLEYTAEVDRDEELLHH